MMQAKLHKKHIDKYKIPGVMSLFGKSVFSSFVIPRGQMNGLHHEE